MHQEPTPTEPTIDPRRNVFRSVRLVGLVPLLAAAVILAFGFTGGAPHPGAAQGFATATRTSGGAATQPPRPTSAPRPTPTPIDVEFLPTTEVQPPARPTADPAATVEAQSGLLLFEAADWEGGYYQEDGGDYGRPWVAVYGAASDYPSASLVFTLAAAPTGPVPFTFAGLDDELEFNNEIALEVNGERVYEGPSPFANWDGTAAGAEAAWTVVEAELPARLLQVGENEITIYNLEPDDSFNSPPYILLAEASLMVGDDGQNNGDNNGENTGGPPTIAPRRSAGNTGAASGGPTGNRVSSGEGTITIDSNGDDEDQGDDEGGNGGDGGDGGDDDENGGDDEG